VEVQKITSSGDFREGVGLAVGPPRWRLADATICPSLSANLSAFAKTVGVYRPKIETLSMH